MSKKKNGVCHLCGREGELTFEHVPPKSAFNKATIYTDVQQNIAGTLKVKPKQGGFGAYTLCKKCNNDTGTNYGGEFVRLAKLCDEITSHWDREGIKQELVVLRDVYPLRFLKQIITCFFSDLPPTFSEKFPVLRDFILDRQNQTLSDGFRFFINLCKPSDDKTYVIHQTNSASINFGYHKSEVSHIACLIRHPPFQLMMTMDGDNLSDATEITRYSKYRFDEKLTRLHLYLKMVDSNSPYFQL